MCRRIWFDADRRVSSSLTYVEVAAALALAERRGRLSSDDHDQALSIFAELWPQVDVVEISGELIAQAARLARIHALRGYDAVHCAAAAELDDADLVAVSGDAQLITAWAELGLGVINAADEDRRPDPH